MDNKRELHEHIAESGWYIFRLCITHKCKEYSCVLRAAKKFFKSSKTCCKCGWVNKNLRLSDRVFNCNDCDNIIDMDVNASINLRNTKEYSIVCKPAWCAQV